MNRAADNALGIYVSIPFCRSKCTYCNFASGVYPASDHARYVERLIEDLAAARTWSKGRGAELPARVDTVYLGGGTPTLLAPELLAKLFAAMRAEFSLDADAEITVECAPGQLADAMLEAMAAAGVNRVSLGVQSFVDSEAHASGRLHNRATVEADLRRLRAAGITNLNVDLIAGLGRADVGIVGGVAGRRWRIRACLTPACTCWKWTRTRGWGAKCWPAGRAIAPGWCRTTTRLRACMNGRSSGWRRRGSGSTRFRTSAGRGSSRRHNLRYWQRRPYLGVGLDASSMLRSPAMLRESRIVSGRDFSRAADSAKSMRALAPAQVLRSTTTDDLKAFLAGTGIAETAWLSPARQHEEAWFLGLRMNVGVDVAALEREFGREMVEPAIETVEAARERWPARLRRRESAAHPARAADFERRLSGVSEPEVAESSRGA